MDAEYNVAVVLDNGSSSIKAGLCGDERPRDIIPTCSGYPKHTRVMLQTPKAERAYGKKAMNDRGLYKLSYPMIHGIVEDWNSMTSLWENVYKESLKTPPEEHPVLLTESPLNPIRNRLRTSEIFFETFNVPALYFAPQAVLALYASGRLTGCVIDSGHGVTQCVPIYDGFALPHAITRMDVSGNEVTQYLQILLRKYGITFHTSAEMETIRDIKEKLCELRDPPKENNNIMNQNLGISGSNVNINSNSNNPNNVNSSNVSSNVSGIRSTLVNSNVSNLNKDDEEMDPMKYILPDGKQLQIGSARYKAPEVLFDPSLLGLEYRGIQYCIIDSINKADLDLRRDLYHNILLSGGSTQFHNFGKRLLNEIQPRIDKAKVKIWAPQERHLTTWIGGSLLSGLGGFRPMWINKKEYQENGTRILYSKALF